MFEEHRFKGRVEFIAKSFVTVNEANVWYVGFSGVVSRGTLFKKISAEPVRLSKVRNRIG